MTSVDQLISPAEASRLASLGFILEWSSEDEDSTETPTQRLVLRDTNEPKLLPLSVDFLSGAVRHRLKTGVGKNQPIGKALGLRSQPPEEAPYVLDCTAGLGVDAFFIAALGCRVRAVERSEVVYALLADGFRRLAESGEFEALTARLSFEHGSARDVLMSLNEQDRPDVIYLDPMYPEEGRSKKALPKKGMQIFRRLIGDDLDADELMDLAITKARHRVVVKRPLAAPPLRERPTHSFEGKTARFDMHLKQEQK